MTPDEFKRTVLPDLVATWERGCFCARPGFRKLLSFNFEDYHTKLASGREGYAVAMDPLALADSEIVGYELVAQRFEAVGPVSSDRNGEQRQTLRCPSCGISCESVWDQYSINMDRQYYRFDQTVVPSPVGYFLVGFYGYGQPNRVRDFVRAASPAAFIDFVTNQGPAGLSRS